MNDRQGCRSCYGQHRLSFAHRSQDRLASHSGLAQAIAWLIVCVIGLHSADVLFNSTLFHDILSAELTAAEPATSVTCQLQLTWKSQSPRRWAGRVSIASPHDLQPLAKTLSEPVNLCRGMLLTGGIQLSDNHDLLTFAPSPSTRHLLDRDGKAIATTVTEGGVGFSIQASPDDRVVISLLRDDSDEYTKPVAVPIRDLLDGRSIQNQFSQTAAWTLRRVDGDRLHVTVLPQSEAVTTNESLPGSNASHQAITPASVPNLLWDDQPGKLQVRCDAAGNQTLELSCELYRDQKPIGPRQHWTVTFADGIAEVLAPAWQPPAGDGSYDALWRLSTTKEPKSVMGLSIPNALGNPMSIIRSSSDSLSLESRSHLVVLSRQPQYPASAADDPQASADPVFTDVGRIEPFGRSWSVSKMIPIKQASQLVGVSSTPELIRRNFSGAAVGELSQGSAWEYSLPVGQVGRRHRVKLVVPAGLPMKLGVVLFEQAGDSTSARSIRDYLWTQNRLKTNDEVWKTVTLDFYPQSSQTRIRLEDRGGYGPVVFQRIEVQQLEQLSWPNSTSPTSLASSAPASDQAQSQFHAQAGGSAAGRRTAWLQIDGASWLERFGTLSVDPLGHATYTDPFVAAQRLLLLMRQSGMNGVALTINQDGRAFYPTQQFTSDRSGQAASYGNQLADSLVLPMLLRLFDREQIAFLPCVRLNTPVTQLESLIADASPDAIGIAPGNLANGLSLDLSLKQAGRTPCLIYNPLHPAVASSCKAAIDELADQLQGHSSVRGIGLFVDQGSLIQLPPVAATMDATTLNRFHQSLPADTVARSQLIGWIQSDGAKLFDRWRRIQVQDLFVHAANRMRDNQRRVMVLTSDTACPTYLAELEQDDAIALVGLVRRSPLEPLAVRCRDELMSAHVMGTAASAIATSPVKMDTAYVLPTVASTNAETSSGAPSGYTPSRTTPLLDWSNQSWLVARLLNKVDPTNLFLDANAFNGHDSLLSRSIQEWIALPVGSYDEVNPSSGQQKLIRLRSHAISANSLLVAATNPSRWPIQVQLLTNGVESAEPWRRGQGDRVKWTSNQVQFTLAPGELLAVRLSGSAPTITDCQTRTSNHESDLMLMSDLIRSLAERLTMITEPRWIPVLDNPGFELAPAAAVAGNAVPSGSVPAADAKSNTTVSDALPGWMVAQYPADCVSWDREFASQGSGAARLRNSDGRPGGTWMVSRAFAAPASGRVLVSVRLRGEPSSAPEKAKPIQVRLSVEGTVAQSNLRESTIVSVPRDGRWSKVPCQVEIDQLPACGVDALRIAIDVMNEGTVWVDDVQVADQFMTDQERNHLQSQMYLAMGGIPKGDLMAAAKLLESHWIQELLSGAWDITRPAIVSQPEQPVAPPAEVPAQEQTPGIAERLKSWLPKPMRY